MKIFISNSRNVFNQNEEFKAFADRLTNDDHARTWITSTFRKWLLNNGPAVKVTEVGADSPQWARDAAAAGELYQIDWDAAEVLVRPLLDYFQYCVQQGRPFYTFSYDKAVKETKEYHDALAAAAGSSTKQEDGTAIVKSCPNGYKWVSVFGKSSLDREGEIMGHCVGSYYKEVADGNVVIYSLRDSKNIPHVTIEVSPHEKTIDQIKGTANTQIKAKYKPYVLEFFSLQPFIRIALDESGIKKSEAVAAVKIIPGSTKNISYEGADFEYVVPDTPAFSDDSSNGASPHVRLHLGRKILTLEDGWCEANSSDRTLTAPGVKKLISTLKYCQLHEICGFSPYDSALRIISSFSGDVDLAQYKKELFEHSTYTQNVGTLKFVFSKSGRAGAFWSLSNSINKKATVIVLAGDKIAVELFESNGTIQIIEVRKSLSTTQIADLRKWIGDRKIGLFALRRNKQLTALLQQLRGETAEIDQLPAGHVTDYHNIGEHLVKAVEFFAGTDLDKLQVHARACDKLNDVKSLRQYLTKNGIKMSGYLYDYFTAFFILLLMRNKDLAFSCITSMPAMVKQFQAFTILPNSIQSGAFARHNEDDVGRFYHEVNKNMKYLLPWRNTTEDFDYRVDDKLKRIRKRFYS